MSDAKELERQRQIAEVKTYCERLLQTAAAKEVYPTPVDRLVEAAELVKSGDSALLELSEDAFPQRLWRKLKGSLSDLLSVVKAGLFTREKTIFINPNTHAASVPFATLHECVHNILPWQKDTFVFLDSEKTFDPKTRYRFEREANCGGSYLLWQGDDYVKRAHDMPITTATPVNLADLYGGSIHSSMRYYVENHREPLILLVVKDNGPSANGTGRYTLQYPVTSQAFKSRFGNAPVSLRNDDDHVLFRRANALNLYWEGETYINLEGERHSFLFFGYETPYNIFVVLTPKKVARRYGKPVIVLEHGARPLRRGQIH